ncbi:Uncharacterised protein [Mycobacterium tuberculosis]|nr:Uncharacterised protein [Mycobacterium tuberculosis]
MRSPRARAAARLSVNSMHTVADSGADRLASSAAISDRAFTSSPVDAPSKSIAIERMP